LKPKKIHGESIANLLELLKEWEDNTRQLAKVELAKHDAKKVATAAAKWAAALDKSDKEFEHHRLEALWTHQWVDVVNVDLLKQVLASPDARARAAATRVLCYWKDRVPGALAMLKTSVNDEDQRVRMQAVRALSFYQPTPDAKAALEIAYDALKQPMDYYIDHVFGETRKGLQSVVKDKVLPADAAVLTVFLEKTEDGDLNGLPKIEPVLTEMILRTSVKPDVRTQAVADMAKQKNASRVTVITDALKTIEAAGGKLNKSADELGKFLVMEPKPELAKGRDALLAVASSAKQAPVRRNVYAAVIVSDGSPEQIWSASDAATRNVLIESIGLIPANEAALRGKFQPLLTALLADGKLNGASLRAVLTALPLMGADSANANFTVVAKSLVEGKERTAAARALLKFPRTAWAADQAKPITETVLAYAKTVPVGDRSKQDYVEVITAAKEIAALLPDDAAKATLKNLRAVSVDIFIIHTVHEQLRYDTTKLTVQAGKPFEVIFENDDVMPHNFVIVPPGKHTDIGTAAMTMTPSQLDKEGRAYLPKAHERDIIAATKLIEPGRKEQIKVKAPGKPGKYEFVCTFPGHALIMWGTLEVVKDLDAGQ
jgi:azurin